MRRGQVTDGKATKVMLNQSNENRTREKNNFGKESNRLTRTQCSFSMNNIGQNLAFLFKCLLGPGFVCAGEQSLVGESEAFEPNCGNLFIRRMDWEQGDLPIADCPLNVFGAEHSTPSLLTSKETYFFLHLVASYSTPAWLLMSRLFVKNETEKFVCKCSWNFILHWR